MLFAVKTRGWERTITTKNSVDNPTSLAIDVTATTNFQERICCLCIQIYSAFKFHYDFTDGRKWLFLTWCQFWDEALAENSSLYWVRCLNLHLLTVLLVRYQDLNPCIAASLWLLKRLNGRVSGASYGEDVGVALLKLESRYESWLTAWWSEKQCSVYRVEMLRLIVGEWFL